VPPKGKFAGLTVKDRSDRPNRTNGRDLGQQLANWVGLSGSPACAWPISYVYRIVIV
jgi:hypothetical protein